MPHTLLRSQKNDVFQAIQEAGFDPAEFEWNDDFYVSHGLDGINAPRLDHQPTDFYFIFDWNGQHIARFSPAAETPSGVVVAGATWSIQLAFVRRWLENLKREYYAPNLWGELERQRELAAAVESDDAADDRPFTATEQALIAQQLDQIKQLLIRTEELNAAQLRRLEASVEGLKTDSRKMGRREWLTVFYGTVFPWALSGLVSPDGVRQVIMLATHGLAHLFGTPPAQLMP